MLTNEKRPRAFDMFTVHDEVQVNRIGKKITVRVLRDGSFVDSDTAEANLLFEILRQLKK